MPEVPSSVRNNLLHRTIERLFVQEYVGRNKHRKSVWRCKCQCGNIVDIDTGRLESGNTTSCGCAKSYTPEEAWNAFWEKVDKNGPTPASRPDLGQCWVWLGAKRSANGAYGHMLWGGKFKAAHRIAYEMLISKIPKKRDLDHLCRNPSCVNPIHMEPVTHRENVLRGESPFAKRALQTHCKHGHEFTPETTYITKRGTRCCRACHVRQVTEAKARKKSQQQSAPK